MQIKTIKTYKLILNIIYEWYYRLEHDGFTVLIKHNHWKNCCIIFHQEFFIQFIVLGANNITTILITCYQNALCYLSTGEFI